MSSGENELLSESIWDRGINVASNEARVELFQKYIERRAGGYLGVGGVQNLILAAWARSEYIWLIDCTKRIVASNYIHIDFLKHTKSVDNFRHLWTYRAKQKALEIISHMKLPHYLTVDYCAQTWEMGCDYMLRYFSLLDELSMKLSYQTCFNDQYLYDYIRLKALQEKIYIVPGKLEGNALIQIAREAKQRTIPLRVIYLSNVEEYFREYPSGFLKNIETLPLDNNSVILRTITFYQNKYPWAEYSERLNNRGFHYNVMSAELFRKELLSGAKNVFQVIKLPMRNPARGLTIVL